MNAFRSQFMAFGVDLTEKLEQAPRIQGRLAGSGHLGASPFAD